MFGMMETYWNDGKKEGKVERQKMLNKEEKGK